MSGADSRLLVPTLAPRHHHHGRRQQPGAPLVPSVATDFDVRLTSAQWSLTAPLIVGAASTPLVGRFASGRLRRPTILVGLVVVATGTSISAFAAATGADLHPGFELLVAGRAMQGVGMALLPLAIAVARDELSGQRLTRSVALLSVTTVAGAGAGYPLTALAAELGGLAAAYLLGLGLTGVTLAMASLFVPRNTSAPPMRVDWPGAALLASGVLGLLLAISQGEVWGWGSIRVGGLAVAGVATLCLWATRTLSSATPLVDLRLATRHDVAAPNMIALVAGIGMYSLLTLAVVLVRADGPGFGLGRSVVVAGLILVPYSIMSVLGSRLARPVLTHLGSRALLPLGCVMFLAASLSLAFYHNHLWQAMLAMALGGAGSGFTFSSLPVLMVPHVPPSETASAMAFNQVLRYLGFTVGSAATPALLALFGAGAEGFRATLGVMCVLWVVAGLGATWLDRPQVASRRPDPA